MTPQDMDREKPQVDAETQGLADYVASRVEQGVPIWIMTRALLRLVHRSG